MRFSKKGNSLIAGDFNLSVVEWENDSVQNNQDCLIQFINTIHVKKPTGYREEETYLVLTNEEGMVDTIDLYPGLGQSDQECLLFELKCSKETYEYTSLITDYFKGYEKIGNTLENKDWYTILQGEISGSYVNLCSVLEQKVTDK